jgi:hypothetical protein
METYGIFRFTLTARAKAANKSPTSHESIFVKGSFICTELDYVWAASLVTFVFVPRAAQALSVD